MPTVKLDDNDVKRLRKFHGLTDDSSTTDKLGAYGALVAQQVISKSDIAKVLDWSPSYLHRMTKDFAPVTETEPDDDPLTDELRALISTWSIQGFEAFMDRYSEFPLYDLHRSIAIDILEHRMLTVSMPPRHAKTWLLTFFSLWLTVCVDRDASVLYISQTGTLSEQVVREIEAQVSGTKLEAEWGPLVPEARGEAVSHWRPGSGALLFQGKQVQKGVNLSYLARGVGQAILGLQATLIVVDDPQTPESVQSPTERERLSRYLKMAALTRLQPMDPERPWRGRAVVVMQRLGTQDLIAELHEEKVEHGKATGAQLWYPVIYPAIRSVDGKSRALWPEGGWDLPELEVVRNRIGSSTWETMFMQNPEAAGSLLMNAEDVPLLLDKGRVNWQLRRVEGDVGEDDGPSTETIRVLSVDPSPTQWNALIAAELEFDPEVNTHQAQYTKVQVLRAWRFKSGVDAGKRLFAEVAHAVGRYGITNLIVEQSSFWQWAVATPEWQDLFSRVTYIQHKTGTNKNSTEYGVMGLQPQFQSSMWSFPYGDELSRQETDQFIAECLEWPNGKTFDFPMAAWFISWNGPRLRNRQRALTSGQMRPVPGQESFGYIQRAREAQGEQELTQQQQAAWWRARKSKSRAERVAEAAAIRARLEEAERTRLEHEEADVARDAGISYIPAESEAE